jgi:hypothetical protein
MVCTRKLLRAYTSATPLVVDDDSGMSPESRDEPAAPEPQADPAAATERPDPDEHPDSTAAEKRQRRRNPWIWISAVLAVVAVGLLVWALTSESDNDSTDQQLASTQEQLDGTQAELESTQKELDSAKQDVEELQQSSAEDSGDGRAVLTAGAFAAVKAVVDDLEEQLGATQDDLAAADEEIKQANDQAEQAAEDAAAAKNKAAQASDETEKAQAEADQAKAEAQAAESKAAVVADCARAYVSAFGQLFEGDDAGDQADAVREQLNGITAECKTAFDDA